MAWLFDDEDESRSIRALVRLEGDGGVVPQIWHLETRNALLAAERRGRLSSRQVAQRLHALRRLPVRTDDEPDLQSAFDLARKHGLSMYDAMYLELAKREEAELATLDRAVGRAAATEAVALLA